MGSCPDTDIDPKNLTTQNKEPFRINTERIRRNPPGPLVAQKNKHELVWLAFIFLYGCLQRGSRFFLIYTTTASSREKHRDALLFSKLLHLYFVSTFSLQLFDCWCSEQPV